MHLRRDLQEETEMLLKCTLKRPSEKDRNAIIPTERYKNDF
jgi:hypothetical protein